MTPAFPAGVFLSCTSVSRQLPCRRLHISLSGAEKHSFQYRTLLRHNPGAKNPPLAHQTAPPHNFRCREDTLFNTGPCYATITVPKIPLWSTKLHRPTTSGAEKTLSLPSGMDLSGRKIIFVLSET